MRPAEPADLAALVALDEACFPPRERWPAASWEAELAASDRWVRVVGDAELVAAATFSAVAGSADLLRVLVASASRGQGLARELVAAGCAWAASTGADQVLLEVRQDNVPAIGLYTSLGFSAIAERPEYYGPGADALVMRLGL